MSFLAKHTDHCADTSAVYWEERTANARVGVTLFAQCPRDQEGATEAGSGSYPGALRHIVFIETELRSPDFLYLSTLEDPFLRDYPLFVSHQYTDPRIVTVRMLAVIIHILFQLSAERRCELVVPRLTAWTEMTEFRESSTWS
jgi:hypothetical protein